MSRGGVGHDLALVLVQEEDRDSSKG